MRKLSILLFMLFTACESDVLPRPKAYLALSYAEPRYQPLSLSRPYSFEVSNRTQVQDAANYWLKIRYPRLKASIDITYRPIQNNLRELLQESEKLVFKHTVKADNISAQNFMDEKKKVYGTLHEITGNAASQMQFHLTDSTQHFIKGALYFNVKPNYDSILPAVAYIKKDVLRLIETLSWSH